MTIHQYNQLNNQSINDGDTHQSIKLMTCLDSYVIHIECEHLSRTSLCDTCISKWDVSKVTGTTSMFIGAESFKQQLGGAAWVHSKMCVADVDM